MDMLCKWLKMVRDGVRFLVQMAEGGIKKEEAGSVHGFTFPGDGDGGIDKIVVPIPLDPYGALEFVRIYFTNGDVADIHEITNSGDKEKNKYEIYLLGQRDQDGVSSDLFRMVVPLNVDATTIFVHGFCLATILQECIPEGRYFANKFNQIVDEFVANRDKK